MNKKGAFFSVSLLAITIVFLSGGYLFLHIETQNIEQKVRSALFRAHSVFVAGLDDQYIQHLNGSLGDLENPDYLRLKNRTVELGKLFREDNIVFFYVMKKTENGIVFLFDSVPPGEKGYSAPGEIYTHPSSAVRDVFKSGKAQLVGPYIDEYGTFISYFSPIRDASTGVIIAVAGSDVDYNAYVSSLKKRQFVYFLFLFFVYLFCVWAFFFFFKKRESQRALRESEEQLRIMGDTVPDAVIMMDNHGAVSFWNRSAEILTGYTKEEAMGKNLHELLSPKDLYDISHSKNLEEFMKKGKSPVLGVTVIIQIQTKDGKRKDVELLTNGLRIKKRWYAIGSLRDISEKRKAEEALQQKNEELEKMNRFMVNREQRMIELKKEIEQLKKKIRDSS